jgi:hypothetical protein
MTAGLVVVVRVFFVSVGHLRSLGGLLENDYEFDVFIPNGLKLLIHDPKTAVDNHQIALALNALMINKTFPPKAPTSENDALVDAGNLTISP